MRPAPMPGGGVGGVGGVGCDCGCMSRTWFWTRSVAAERTASLHDFASAHGGFVVAEEREPGVFARSFPVAHGRHREREVVIRFGPDGYNTRRTASATHTVIALPSVGGLPSGLRVFRSLRGGLSAKGGRRGEAAVWLAAGGREAALGVWLERHGYVAISEAIGLRVHIAGVDHDPAKLARWLDAVDSLASALE